MGKNTVPLKVVFADEALLVRGNGKLINGVEARRAKVLADERGRLGEIMRADDPWFEKFGQVYFTTTYPGVVKAWHHHNKQMDHFYVAKGTVKIALYDSREKSETFGVVNEIYLGEHCPGMVRIPPGVLHGWMCIGQNESYIINMVSEMYNYAEPDEFRVSAHENEIPYDWSRKDG